MYICEYTTVGFLFMYIYKALTKNINRRNTSVLEKRKQGKGGGDTKGKDGV